MLHGSTCGRAHGRRHLALVAPGRDRHRRLASDNRAGCARPVVGERADDAWSWLPGGRRRASAEEVDETGVALGLCEEEVGAGELGGRGEDDACEGGVLGDLLGWDKVSGGLVSD